MFWDRCGAWRGRTAHPCSIKGTYRGVAWRQRSIPGTVQGVWSGKRAKRLGAIAGLLNGELPKSKARASGLGAGMSPLAPPHTIEGNDLSWQQAGGRFGNLTGPEGT